MSTLSIRKSNDTKAMNPSIASTFDPLRTMHALLHWDPFGEMLPLQTEFAAAFNPTFDVKETKDAYLFKADMPGLKEADLEVSATGNRITIHGKRESEKEEKSERYYACERTYGSFTRAFTLPEGANVAATHAELKDGVLTIAIPKMPELQPKKIPVGSPSAKA
jgi:HSP20 family protein